MINILLEGFDIDAPWLYDELKNYIQPNHSVAVVAFSFRDNRVKSLSDWNALYSKECGKYHDGIVGGFTTYGIPEENINFINYFTDTKGSAAQKIKSADIVYFLGGLPDRMMDRIKEFDLYDILMQHDGILMARTPACRPLPQNAFIFRFSIWRPATAVRTNAFRRRPTAGSWTSFRT